MKPVDIFGSYRYEEEKDILCSKSVVDSHPPPPQRKENIQQKWPGKHQIKKTNLFQTQNSNIRAKSLRNLSAEFFLLSGYLPFTNPQLGVNHPSISPSTKKWCPLPPKKRPTYGWWKKSGDHHQWCIKPRDVYIRLYLSTGAGNSAINSISWTFTLPPNPTPKKRSYTTPFLGSPDCPHSLEGRPVHGGCCGVDGLDRPPEKGWQLIPLFAGLYILVRSMGLVYLPESYLHEWLISMANVSIYTKYTWIVWVEVCIY